MSEREGPNNFEMLVEIPQEKMNQLDGLSEKSKSTGGEQIRPSVFIRAAISTLLMENGTDFSGITSEEDVIKRILGS